MITITCKNMQKQWWMMILLICFLQWDHAPQHWLSSRLHEYGHRHHQWWSPATAGLVGESTWRRWDLGLSMFELHVQLLGGFKDFVWYEPPIAGKELFFALFKQSNLATNPWHSLTTFPWGCLAFEISINIRRGGAPIVKNLCPSSLHTTE